VGGGGKVMNGLVGTWWGGGTMEGGQMRGEGGKVEGHKKFGGGVVEKRQLSNGEEQGIAQTYPILKVSI